MTLRPASSAWPSNRLTVLREASWYPISEPPKPRGLTSIAVRPSRRRSTPSGREIGAQHPRHLLVLLHEPGQEVAGAGVTLFGGRLEVGAELANDGLVIAQQIRDHGLGLG